ncbi:MAG: hypothetical protein ACLP8S_08850, partial [Solirubrobacteraceae bacterium]
VKRRTVERDHERPLASVFGEVTVSRLAYRARGEENLYVADGLLNLPEEHAHRRPLGPGRMATSTSTGPSTSPRNTAAFTPHATPLASSRHPHKSLQWTCTRTI